MNRLKLAVDFDGTIVDHSYPDIGTLKPGVKEALARLIEDYEIVIWSCRASARFQEPEQEKYYHDMLEFLKRHEIPFDSIDTGNSGKITAFAYIDDRAIPFENNWAAIAGSLSEAIKEWKK